MSWERARFKDGEVWAEVDASGKPVVLRGMRAIRYSDRPGAKVYRAGAAAVEGLGGVVEFDDGALVGLGSAGSRSVAQEMAAKADARKRIGAIGADTAVAYTDGACTGNPGPAGSGLVLRFPDGRTVERHRALGKGTNNIAELTAIGMALEALDEAALDPKAPVVVFTDSKYAIGVLAQGWKAKANVELIARLRAALKSRASLRLEWVAGHVGVEGNERADALARKGVAESRGG